jgi:5-formyltetrahydrofolate cyclo-ligase
LRSEIWSLLQENGASQSNPFGHIPSFNGAELAAARLSELPIWRNANVIKCNPDSPQIPVRLRAIQEGKILYMAVPRLVNERCFVELTATHLREQGIPFEEAATHQGALKSGRLVLFEEMRPIELVISGCVAVTPNGGRTGKGAGFADLELGMLQEFKLITDNTPIITTVHPLQIVDNSRLPLQAHDWPLDWIVTPDEIIETHSPYKRPTGIDWNAVQPDQFDSIPVLRKLFENQ